MPKNERRERTHALTMKVRPCGQGEGFDVDADCDCGWTWIGWAEQADHAANDGGSRWMGHVETYTRTTRGAL